MNCPVANLHWARAAMYGVNIINKHHKREMGWRRLVVPPSLGPQNLFRQTQNAEVNGWRSSQLECQQGNLILWKLDTLWSFELLTSYSRTINNPYKPVRYKILPGHRWPMIWTYDLLVCNLINLYTQKGWNSLQWIAHPIFHKCKNRVLYDNTSYTQTQSHACWKTDTNKQTHRHFPVRWIHTSIKGRPSRPGEVIQIQG